MNRNTIQNIISGANGAPLRVTYTRRGWLDNIWYIDEQITSTVKNYKLDRSYDALSGTNADNNTRLLLPLYMITEVKTAKEVQR